MFQLIYITGLEVYEHLSVTNLNRLNKLAAGIEIPAVVYLLIKANILVGLFPAVDPLEGIPFNAAEFWAVQNFLCSNFFPPEIMAKFASSRYHGRPVFHRQQLLFLIKQILIHGQAGPVENKELTIREKYLLGRLSLNANNLLVTPEQEDRLGEHFRRRSPDELLLQLLPVFELYNPPAIDRGIARSLGYLQILEAELPKFVEDRSLDEYFKERTGVGLTSFLEFVIGVYANYFNQEISDLLFHPEKFNLSLINYFPAQSFDRSEKDAFFKLICRNFDDLKAELEDTSSGGVEQQYDFTVFRKYPLVDLTHDNFICLDVGCLLEKVPFGLYRTIHNALPDDPDDPSRKVKSIERKLSSSWGKTIEKYANGILSGAADFYDGIEFKAGPTNVQIDGAFNEGKHAIIIEIKGGALSRKKYSGDKTLLDEIDQKFGRGKSNPQRRKNDAGCRQLVADLVALYPSDEVAKNLIPDFKGSIILEAEEIYPVLIVNESAFNLDVSQLKLLMWFNEELEERRKEISERVNVHPVLILPIEELEGLEYHLQNGDFTMHDLVRFYSSHIKKALPFWSNSAEAVINLFFKERGLTYHINTRMEKLFQAFAGHLTEKLPRS